MSAQPTVVAVCLTADRPAMTRQAVESFRAQTYPADKRMLLIFDSGDDPQWYKGGAEGLVEVEFSKIK